MESLSDSVLFRGIVSILPDRRLCGWQADKNEETWLLALFCLTVFFFEMYFAQAGGLSFEGFQAFPTSRLEKHDLGDALGRETGKVEEIIAIQQHQCLD